jgi:hypothetical protein
LVRFAYRTIRPTLTLRQDSLFDGIYPRWHVSFNITMLRLVSFSMDYYWACSTTAGPSEVCYLRCLA